MRRVVLFSAFLSLQVACGASTGLYADVDASEAGCLVSPIADAAVDVAAGDCSLGFPPNPEVCVGAVAPRPPVTHRPVALACALPSPPAEPKIPPALDAGGDFPCLRHADCAAGTRGVCLNRTTDPFDGTYCVYDECEVDSDCPDPGGRGVCICGPNYNYCAFGSCEVDAECVGENLEPYCSPTRSGDGYILGYFCHRPCDVCIEDGDCPSGDVCRWTPLTYTWICQHT
jgi:hypothetical protein